MSTIRKQSIISSGVVYFGFALGGLTNYILARDFNPDQYGLINGMFVAIGTVLSYVASVGMPPYVVKFYPYYNDNLELRENDMMAWALLVAGFGCVLTCGLGFLLRPYIIHFYEGQSSELVKYYYWIFPFGIGMTLFGILEAYGWHIRESVLTNKFRELGVRIVTLVLIMLYLSGILGTFGNLVKLYAFNYLLVSLILLIYLIRSGKMMLVFSVSRVTRKFFPKIRGLVLMAWGGNLFFYLSFYFAQIVIAGVVTGGLTAVGIFTLAQFMGSLIQAPQRSVLAAATGPLAQAWKDKDLERIARIYHRSAIVQLVFSVGMFVLILINYRDGILTFHLKPAYLAGETVFIFIGLSRIVDLGSGINSQIIGTSVHWRFELFSGMILLCLTIPLNYLLAKRMGLLGPAVADLITFFVYNLIRWLFLYRKYGLQPFDRKCGYTLLLGLVAWFLCSRLFGALHGLIGMCVRSTAFLLLYVGGVFILRLSEDAVQVWQTVRGRLSRMGRRSSKP